MAGSTTAPHDRTASTGRAPHSARRRKRTPTERVAKYLKDPFLRHLYEEVERAGNVQAISLDLTHVCQLRCEGCYFFSEQMDESKAPRDEAVFDAFIESEKARGTNYMTVLGGEPTLALDRLKKLHDNFSILPVTNGIRKIPMKGFEEMPIAVSVWGDHEIDKMLRGAGKIDVFSRALRNYKDDSRVGWYFTVSTGNAHIMQDVVDEIVANGNYVYFSYYEDKEGLGGSFDDRAGFGEVRKEIDRLIEVYPDRILTTSYVAKIATTDTLFDMRWGYDVCATVSSDYEKNRERLRNGKPYSPHFRAYMPDLKSLRRCPVGEDSDCSQCHNAYARHSWIMINRDLHLDSKQDFTNWLTSVYMFYLAGRMVNWEAGLKLLPEIHNRTRAARADREGATS
jgi:MoaA/NifB/PqqE/SkfB family radical SAM enzyme